MSRHWQGLIARRSQRDKLIWFENGIAVYHDVQPRSDFAFHSRRYMIFENSRTMIGPNGPFRSASRDPFNSVLLQKISSREPEHSQNQAALPYTVHITYAHLHAMGRGGCREVIRVKPGAAAAVHSKAAQLQNAAGGAGVRVNRVFTATAKPLARTSVHATGTRAAKKASKAVASCANNARRAVHSAATTAGGKNSAAAEVGVGLFEIVASAPVFVAQALHSPKYMSSSPPLPPPPPPPQLLPPPPPSVSKPPRPSNSKPTHHWVGNQWQPVQQAVQPNGKPYKPPPGYPAAKKKHRKKQSCSRKKRH